MRVSSGALARVPDAQVQPRPSPRPVRPSRARPGLSSVCRASDPWASASLVNYTAPSLSRRSTGQIADADDRLREGGKKKGPVDPNGAVCRPPVPAFATLVTAVSGIQRCYALQRGRTLQCEAHAKHRKKHRTACRRTKEEQLQNEVQQLAAAAAKTRKTRHLAKRHLWPSFFPDRRRKYLMQSFSAAQRFAALLRAQRNVVLGCPSGCWIRN